MNRPSIAARLGEWRASERRWERETPPAEETGLAVVRAFVAYQDLALPEDSFMLIADDKQTYVGVTRGVTRVLGYQPSELLGRRISDLAAPEIRDAAPGRWQAFLEDGRQDGVFRLLRVDGQVISLLYQARAHHPVGGFHTSRLWPEQDL